MATGLAGASIAGYSIEGVAGRGGMGIVYRARDTVLDRVVALKVIAPEHARDPKFRQRFLRETVATAGLDHPNVIPVYGAGEDGEGQLYIVMRFVEGDDLGALLHRRGALEPALAAEIVAQAASALDAAHARGLVHRDVKPGNVLVKLGSRPHVYLTDFGLVKWEDTTGALTSTTSLLGTPDYAAPEQVDGRPSDARSDVYALACVLFAALTGRPPFADVPRLRKATAHLHDPPPPLHELAPGVPPAFEKVVRRGLAKDPAERYQAAGELGAATLAAAGSARADRTASTRKLWRRPERLAPTARLVERPARRGILFGLAGALLAAGLALAALAGLFSTGGSHERSAAHRTPPKPPPQANAATGTVRCGATACSEAGKRVQAPIEDGNCVAATGVGVWKRIDAGGAPLLGCMVDPAHIGPAAAAASMPDVVGGRLDLSHAYLEGVGLSHETIGGGILRGIIDDSNWQVCGTSPAAGARVTPRQKVRLFVDRSC